MTRDWRERLQWIDGKPCPRCEKNNDPEANFCCKCGLKMGRASEVEDLLPKLSEVAVTRQEWEIEGERGWEVRRFPVFRFGPDGTFICIKTTTNKRGKVVSDKAFKSSLAAHSEIRGRLLHKHRLLDEEEDEKGVSAYLRELPGPLPAVISLALEAKGETEMTTSISKYLREMTPLPELSNAHTQDSSSHSHALGQSPRGFLQQLS